MARDPLTKRERIDYDRARGYVHAIIDRLEEIGALSGEDARCLVAQLESGPIHPDGLRRAKVRVTDMPTPCYEEALCPAHDAVMPENIRPGHTSGPSSGGTVPATGSGSDATATSRPGGHGIPRHGTTGTGDAPPGDAEVEAMSETYWQCPKCHTARPTTITDSDDRCMLCRAVVTEEQVEVLPLGTAARLAWLDSATSGRWSRWEIERAQVMGAVPVYVVPQTTGGMP
jgi:hypothetical protein